MKNDNNENPRIEDDVLVMALFALTASSIIIYLFTN